MSNKNNNKAQNNTNAVNEEAVVKPKAVFDPEIQVDLLVGILSKNTNDGVKPEVVVDNYITMMFMQFEMDASNFKQFKDMLFNRANITAEKSFADYTASAKELGAEASAVANEPGDFTGMGVEESKVFNFRNGVVGGAMLGAAATILTKGVNAGGLVGAGVSVVGSWFIAGAVEEKVNAATDNQYARTVGGVLLGAGIGSLGTLGGSYAQGFIGNTSEEKEVSGQDHDAPLSELTW